jgi:L-ascorbate metabolism protein UlaG (beta-lactamase superfamily)
MTIDQAVNAAKIIKPKVLFPYHYNDTPVNKITFQLYKEGIKVLVRNYQ